MVASHDGVLAVVIGDDAVAAGMLALDLVQAGFDAHGAGDVWAAAERLRASDVSTSPPVLIAIYQDLKRTLDVWRHLQNEGVRVRVVVAVHEADLVAAEAAAMAGGWLGVLRAPVRTEALIDLLDRQKLGDTAPTGLESGELSVTSVMTVLERELLVARRDPARRNSLLRVESRGVIGEIALVDGELVHEQVDDDRGRHALERLACWQEGGWTLRFGVYSGQHTLTGGWRGQLAVALEYARRVEEARRTMPLRDAVCTVRWERVRPLPVVAEALFRRLASGITLHEALDGRGDDELEAYAALLTRIRRGAVEPLERTVTESPSKYPTSPQRRPGLAQTAHQVMRDVRPSAARHIRTSESHRRPTIRPGSGATALLQGADGRPSHRHGSSSFTQAVRSGSQSGLVSALEVGTEPEGRHSETSTYRTLPLGQFVPTIPSNTSAESKTSASEGTLAHNHVLPAQLPAVESDSWETSPAEQPPSEPVFAATGWFGLNVGKTPDEQFSAQVDAMRDALVQGGEQSAVEQVQARLSQSVSELPRVAPESDGYEADELESHYSLFASDDELDDIYAEEQERSQMELLAPTGAGGRKARLFWLAALVAVTAVLAMVIWPGSPLYEGDATRPPAMRSYQRAVDLIDAGKSEQASALLRMVHGRTSVPAEATLQLAVLDVTARRFSDARTHLEAYLKLPNAQHAEAASKLYAHVFGAKP